MTRYCTVGATSNYCASFVCIIAVLDFVRLQKRNETNSSDSDQTLIDIQEYNDRFNVSSYNTGTIQYFEYNTIQYTKIIIKSVLAIV